MAGIFGSGWRHTDARCAVKAGALAWIEYPLPITPGSLSANLKSSHGRTMHKSPRYKANEQHAIAWCRTVCHLLGLGGVGRDHVEDPVPIFTHGAPLRFSYVLYKHGKHAKGPAKGMPRLDVDAPAKALLDVAQAAGFIEDDSQIFELVGRKRLADSAADQYIFCRISVLECTRTNEEPAI